VLFVLGLVGAVLPFVPGPPLILAGAFLYALTTDFSPVGFGRLVILTVLTGFALVLHYVGSALGTRRYGGSVWGMAGALVGAVVGLFFGLLGLVLGPIVGAVAGELVRGASLEGSVRSGVGAFIGMLFGVVGNVSLGLVMIALFLWWVWRG
jgi:uncharacterized protein YqgC (DUF456 family)